MGSAYPPSTARHRLGTLLTVPATYVATHQTGGLPGFPAVDLFGFPGELVVAGFNGTVTRKSGRACSRGGVPGGAYGRSVYVVNTDNGITRFLTHLADLAVDVGDRVKKGSILGTLCDSAVSGKPGTTHVHVGMNRP